MGNQSTKTTSDDEATKTTSDDEATKRIDQFHKDMTEQRLGTKESSLKTTCYYEHGKKGYDVAMTRWESWSKKYPHDKWDTVHPDNYDIFVCENITDRDTCVESQCVWEPKMSEWIRGPNGERIENPDWISQQNHHTRTDIERINIQGGICRNQLERQEIRQPTRTKIKMKRVNKNGSRLQQMRLQGLDSQKLKAGLRKSAIDGKDTSLYGDDLDKRYIGKGENDKDYVFFQSEIKNGMYVGQNIDPDSIQEVPNYIRKT